MVTSFAPGFWRPRRVMHPERPKFRVKHLPIDSNAGTQSPKCVTVPTLGQTWERQFKTTDKLPRVKSRVRMMTQGNRDYLPTNNAMLTRNTFLKGHPLFALSHTRDVSQ